jgi:hypothetical protein
MLAIATADLRRARELLLDAARIATELGSKTSGQSVLEVCTGLAVARGEWDVAARFYGAAEAQAEDTGLHRDPADEAFLQPRVAELRAAPGAAAFAQGEAAGRALSNEAAVAEASAWLAR